MSKLLRILNHYVSWKAYIPWNWYLADDTPRRVFNSLLVPVTRPLVNDSKHGSELLNYQEEHSQSVDDGTPEEDFNKTAQMMDNVYQNILLGGNMFIFAQDIRKYRGLLNLEFEDLVFYGTHVDTMAAGFKARKLEVPQWLEDKKQEIQVLINIKTRSQKRAALKVMKAKLSTLIPQVNQRNNLEDEIEELEKEIE